MKINYHPTKLKLYLVFAIIWLSLGVAMLKAEPINWTGYGLLVIAGSSFFIYNYSKRYGYLEIKAGFIYKRGFVKKKIKISDINKVQKYKGKYILSTEASNFEINTYLIGASGLEKLNQFLKDSGNE